MRRWSEHEMEAIVARMLRLGVLSAAVVVLVGGVLYLAQNPGIVAHYYSFHGEPLRYRHPVAMAHTILHGDARSITMLGLLLLIATPVVRVLLCLVGFLMQRDRLYVVVSSIVLGVLLYSLFWGY